MQIPDEAKLTDKEIYEAIDDNYHFNRFRSVADVASIKAYKAGGKDSYEELLILIENNTDSPYAIKVEMRHILETLLKELESSIEG